MLQQYALAPGVARSHMHAIDSSITHDIMEHDLKPLSPTRYLLCVENLNSGRSATQFTSSLSKWYVGFLTLDVFKDIDTIADAKFPELTPPAGVFSVCTWYRQGINYRISVCYASDNGKKNPDASSEALRSDEVNVYLRSPPLQASYDGLVETCTSSGARQQELTQHACSRLVQTHGFHKMPVVVDPVDKDIDDQLAKLVISHGSSITASNSSLRYTYCGQFRTDTRETTVASVVLPKLLRHISGIHDACDDATSTPYAIFAVNPYAYALLLPYVGGWTVCVQVNMLAPVEAVIQMFSLQQVPAELVYSRMQQKTSPMNLWTARAYESTVHHALKAVAKEYRRAAGHQIDDLDDDKARKLNVDHFSMYMSHLGLSFIQERARNKKNELIKVQGLSDALYTTHLMLSSNDTVDLKTCLDARVKVVRCALQVLLGNLLRWITVIGKSSPNAKAHMIDNLLKPSLRRYDMWPPVDKALYDTMANSLRTTDPLQWSHHFIKLFEVVGNGGDPDLNEQRLARMLFFSSMTYLVFPMHMRVSSTDEWRATINEVIAVDTFCNDFVVSADDMIAKKVDQEDFCKGLAFMGLCRNLTTAVLDNARRYGAA